MTPSPRLRLQCRTDIDWAAGAAGPDGRLPMPSGDQPLLRGFVSALERSGLVEAWNRQLGVDYHNFRQRLQDIAKTNLDAVDDASVAVGMSSFGEWFASDDDSWVFPVDDDDYFRPDLARVVAGLPAHAIAVFWPAWQYRYDDAGAPECGIVPIKSFMTNNYGISGRWLRETFDETIAERIVVDHVTAAKLVSEHRGAPIPRDGTWWTVMLEADGVEFVPDALSLSLKHVGSLTVLHEAAGREDSTLFERLRLAESAPIPPDVAWAEPWVRSAEALFASLVE